VRVVSLFAIGLVLILIGWLYSLIYRAYGFLKDQLASEALTKNQVDSERAQQNGFVPVAK
jgi:ABC-type phosphate transport system permease subunit